jgi:glycerophosphoryl diester phosphodiesterase
MKSTILALTLTAMTQAAPPILVHGHRGAAAVRPENTIPSFAEAIRAGADYIELDLHATRDDQLVVAHDFEINTAICRGPGGKRAIRSLTLAEVRQYDCGSLTLPSFPRQVAVPGTRIPALGEVFDLVAKHPRVKVNVEIKSSDKHPDFSPAPDAFCRMVAAAIRARKMEKRVLVQSFDFRIVKAMAKAAPELELAALYGTGNRDFTDIARETGVRMVNPHFKLITEAKVRAAHAAGIRIMAWTVDRPEDWPTVLATGVDGIITNDPAGLIEYLRARTGR